MAEVVQWSRTRIKRRTRGCTEDITQRRPAAGAGPPTANQRRRRQAVMMECCCCNPPFGWPRLPRRAPPCLPRPPEANYSFAQPYPRHPSPYPSALIHVPLKVSLDGHGLSRELYLASFAHCACLGHPVSRGSR